MDDNETRAKTQRLVEFYFGSPNFRRDVWLAKLAAENEGFVTECLQLSTVRC